MHQHCARFSVSITSSSSVQLLSSVRVYELTDCSTPGFLSITNSWSLLKPTSIKSVVPYNLLILCRPLFLPPSIFPSIRVFSNESVLHTRWPNYWHFNFSISPSNGYSRLISFRMDWLDLLAVKGTILAIYFLLKKKKMIWESTVFIGTKYSTFQSHG